MKEKTHGWLAFMAIKRLMEVELSPKDRVVADSLVDFFMGSNDDVTQGAWYPDSVYKDNASGHVLKFTPAKVGDARFKSLPSGYLLGKISKESALLNTPYTIAKGTNLPTRCESIGDCIVDNLKIKHSENAGSPIVTTDNYTALMMFAQSHYIADAHVPFHADGRKFSSGANVHGRLEGLWEDEIKKHYMIDFINERFYLDIKGLPECKETYDYEESFLATVEAKLKKRKFVKSYGTGNNNTWDFMTAICQHSYLTSYEFIPKPHTHKTVKKDNWQTLGTVNVEDLNVAILTDAIDSISKVWFQIWKRYLEWVEKHES